MASSGSTGPRLTLQDRLGSLFLSARASLDQLALPSIPKEVLETNEQTKKQLGGRFSASSEHLSLSITPSEERRHRRTASSPPLQQSPIELDQNASESLRQAISDDLFRIQRPPEARMAPGRSLRAPPLLGSLARASMPTSSLTRPLQTAQIQPLPHAQFSLPSTSRASLDSLRTLTARDRQLQAAEPQQAPNTSSNRWWFQADGKKEVDSLLKPEDQADTAQQEAEGIRHKYLTPKIPLVFCHGIFGFDSIQLGPATFAPLQISHWRGIIEVLEENGIEVLVTRVPATSSIEDRARVLEASIAEKYTGREVHLIGHSMGGLDCRYLTSRLRPKAFKIRSVTTIATPHRGSTFANYFLEAVGKARIPTLASIFDYLPNGHGDGKAFELLTVEAMKLFNEETPDVEGVMYFSWGAACEPSLVDAFKWPHSVILEKEGPNDGLVSVESSKWGKYQGTLEDVNHLDLVGWINAARYKWAELTGKVIKFKPASFYLEIADRLAKEVEGLKRDDEEEAPSEPREPLVKSPGGGVD